jgi:hypothetical protein
VEDGEQSECLLCGERFGSEDELTRHTELVHEQDDDFTWGGCLLSIPALLIVGWRWLVGLFVIVGIVLAALGVFDKTKTTDTRSCPGYNFVRDMQSEAEIESFDRVEPESGWLCEYSLNDEEAFVRFKKAGSELQLEIEGRGEAYEAASSEAEAKGYADR